MVIRVGIVIPYTERDEPIRRKRATSLRELIRRC